MVKLLILLVAVGVAIGASFGIACLVAWAITAIWPSLPFWPVALLAWAVAALFSKSSSN